MGDVDIDASLPLVLMLHGRGDRPRVPGGPFACVSVPLRIVMPQAPDSLGPGFTWAERGVMDSLRDTLGLIRSHLKEVILLLLLMFGVGIGWLLISLMIVLPVMLVAAALIGGIPALLVYLISNSGSGAAITGIPLALITLILIGGAAQGLYRIYQSAVWTLAYRELQRLETISPIAPESSIPETPEPQPDL
jgi:hypothetical protein